MECKNCKANLSEESDYCYSCGGKVIRNRLTMRNLFENFVESFFSYDNQFLRTLKHLFSKPWEVVDSYVSGTRKKYISPLSFFAISVTFSGLYVFVVKNYFMDSFAMPQAYDNAASAKIGPDILKITLEYYSLIYFLMIPGLALMSKIVFFNKRYNYTEHIVIFFYTMSLISIVSSLFSIFILNINKDAMMISMLVFYLVYFLYQSNLYRKLFALSVSQLLLKILLFIPIFIAGYFIVSIAIVLLMLSFGMINLQDFVPPS